MKAKTRRAPATDGQLLDVSAFGKAMERAAAKESTVSLLLVDLDDLLVLNTNAGRAAGDRAIAAAIATLGRAASAEGWTVGRVGGDEFAVLAPAVGLEQALLRGDRLRKDLDAALAKAVPAGHRCTASIGVANVPRDAKGGTELFAKAGLALHNAKEQGGDAVGLTPSGDMVLKSSYYSAAQLGRLKGLAERLVTKEAPLLREALDDLLRKYDRS